MSFYYIRSLEIAQKKTKLAPQNVLSSMCKDYVLLQVREGTGEIAIENKIMPIKKGQWILTNKVDSAYASGNQSLKIVMIFFQRMLIENAAIWSVSQRIESMLQYCCDLQAPFTPNEDASFIMSQCVINLILLENDTSASADVNAYAGLWRLFATMHQDALMQGMDEFYSGITLKKRVNAALEYMHQYYSTPITLNELAKISNMSVPNFSSVFRKAMDISPIEYLNRLRIEKSKTLLENENKKIIETSEECGFFTISHFVRLFKRYTGLTPTEYRKMHKKS